jgi:hypothetical protein
MPGRQTPVLKPPRSPSTSGGLLFRYEAHFLIPSWHPPVVFKKNPAPRQGMQQKSKNKPVNALNLRVFSKGGSLSLESPEAHISTRKRV